MYSYNDFERLFVRYKLEGIPAGVSIEKAISYMNTFLTQLFAYLNDGSYSIDNSIAERFIRPLALRDDSINRGGVLFLLVFTLFLEEIIS